MPSVRQTARLGRQAARAVAIRAVPRRREPLRTSRRFSRLWKYLAILGPGLIVANAGNDAGGVFTYSDIGAKYGYSLLWAFVPIAISLIVVQEMVARLGCVTGKGLMDLIREKFGVRWTLFAAVVIIVANGGTTIAEFAGVAGGLGLLGVPRTVAVIAAAILIAIVVLRGNRRFVERIFLALGLSFVSYIVTAFTVRPNWGVIGRGFLTPNSPHPGVATGAYVADVIALIGTSITPYMQLSLQSMVVDKGSRTEDLSFVRADVISGSIFANIVACFIVITTGTTLFFHGFASVGINSAQSAASALQPLAGVHASQLFAVGLIGASLLAAAVLPLSTAFVVCEAFGAERSVQNTFKEAPLFFTLFIGIIAIAAGVMLFPQVPIAAVAIGTQTLDGALLPILLVFIVILANDSRLLGRFRNGLIYNIIALATAGILTVLTGILLITTLFPGLAGS